MPKLYESYIDEDNNKKLMKCIKDYLNGNETQLYYCEKHDVNYHAFKRHWSKYKDKHKEELKQIMAKKEEKINNKDNKQPKYDTTSDNKVFKKQKKQYDDKTSENIKINKTHNGGNNLLYNDDTNQKYERTGSKTNLASAKIFFQDVTDLINK
jgi:hypothetical protein